MPFLVTSSQSVTPTLTSLVRLGRVFGVEPAPTGTTDQNYYEPFHGAAKAIDGDFLSIFRTDTVPSGVILTLGQSMLIRRVRVFTGPVSIFCK